MLHHFLSFLKTPSSDKKFSGRVFFILYNLPIGSLQEITLIIARLEKQVPMQKMTSWPKNFGTSVAKSSIWRNSFETT